MLPKYKFYHLGLKCVFEVTSINFINEKVECMVSEVDNYLNTWRLNCGKLLESTGLFGEGKEIFQGDIIHYKIEDKSNDGSPYTLRELTGYIYKEGNCIWVKANDSEIVPLWCLEDQYATIKILGNIYEHPHLLGED